MDQYRPYLSLRDSFKVFKFCFEKNFFTNDIYNALSGNYTVRQILNRIKKFKKKIFIDFVVFSKPSEIKREKAKERSKIIRKAQKTNDEILGYKWIKGTKVKKI